MNNGAFGENFPYSNFHDLNMDWIIKIAKDFLDQYTHIQQVIADGEQSLTNLTEEGLEQLQTKADNLESLLNTWYVEHSEDIANQLASAIADLNSWYNTHQGYLDQYLTSSIQQFNTAAENKAAETIESIPSDYTALYNNVKNLEADAISIRGKIIFQNGYAYNTNNGELVESSNHKASPRMLINSDCTFYPTTQPTYYLYWNDTEYLGYTTGYNPSQYAGSKWFAFYTNINTQEPIMYMNNNIVDTINTSKVMNIIEKQDTTVAGYANTPFNFISGKWYVIDLYKYTGPVGGVQVSAYKTDDAFNLGIAYAPETFLFNPHTDYDGIYTGACSYRIFEIERDSILTNSFDRTELLDINLLLDTTVSGYTSTPFSFQKNKTYILDVYRYTGPSGGIQVALTKPGTTSLNLGIIYETKTFTFNVETEYEALYTAACSFRIYEVDSDSILQNKNTYTVGSTNCDFAKFTDAIKFAYLKGNCTLLLAPEKFEITTETDIAQEHTGLPIGNGVHIIGCEGTEISCEYTGTSGIVQREFSIFMVDDSDFTIENVKLTGINVRYCVHDECGGTTRPYTHKYINCEMYHDSHTAEWRTPQCIGGGLGTNGLIIIDKGIYESVPTNYSTTDDIGGPYSQTALDCPISYHQNTSNPNAQNKIIINGVYLKGSDSLIKYGSGSNGSVTISNCSMGKEPEQYSPSTLYKWNNEIR